MTEKVYKTQDAILKEFYRQIEESDNDESCSETSDEILENDDDVDDEFDNEIVDVHEDEYYLVDNDEERTFKVARDLETIWTTSQLRSKFAKTPAKNIITHLPSAKGIARGVTDSEKLFSLFINDEMIDILVKCTNQEIERRASQFKSSQWYTSSTDTLEMKALCGLLYMSAVLKESSLNTEDLFSKLYGPPIFRFSMSKNRFEFLLRALRFDDKATRDQRKVSDKFAAFRQFWTLFTNQCKSHYTPAEYLTVDETLLSFRGRCPFKMFMPKKPGKYGLKIVSICDAKTFYFLDGIPYVGKQLQKKVPGDLSMPTKYVLQLTETIKHTNRNITTDNWFTSCELADELSKIKLTLVGTLRKNKPQIPPEMLTSRNASPMSSRFLYDPDKMLVFFTPKKYKQVIVLSSMHYSPEINETSQKPEAIEFYNMTKCGVDVFDQLCHDKSTKRKSRRWPLRYFFGVLDAAGVNAFVLSKLNRPNQSFCSRERTNFLKSLSHSLTQPLMKKRLYNIRLPRELRLSIRSYLGEDEEEMKFKRLAKKPRRCDTCTEALQNKDRKGYSFCIKCSRCLCGEHKVIICSKCVDLEINNNL